MMDTSVLEKKPARETNFFNWIFLTWTIPLFWTGARRDLLATDLDSPSKADESERVADALEREWRLEIERTRADIALLEDKSGRETLSKRKPSLLKAILRVFWFPYMLNGLFLFVEEVILRVLQPWFQKGVIEYFTQSTSGERLDKTAARLQALGLLGTTFAIILISHHVTLSMRQIGMRVRVACSSLVYRKVLRLELGTIRNTAAGRVINLLSNDVSRFDKIVCFLHFLWIMPIQMTVIGYVMWQYVGVSAIIGIAAVVTQTIPIQGYLSVVSARLRALIAIRTDARVQIMSELITGIQVLKMYAWEKPFELMVCGLRAAEMKLIGRATYVRAFYWSAMNFAERVNLYCTLTSFVMMGNLLTPECAFVLTTFFNTIQITSAFGFPQALISSGETGVSIKRLEEFLMLNEVKQSDDSETAKVNRAVVQNEIPKTKNHDRIKIKMDKVTASWSRDQIPRTLSNVSMVVESGSLCGLVGPVGSGKSSLLHLILGELPITSGTLEFYTGTALKVPGNRSNLRVSYCCQEPWLFSGTIRDNILFGQSYDQERYDAVTRICALVQDFEQLPQRDMTHVGERGSSLSGGQRARVNLARAIYRVADVYLFDDLFSAVDTRVGHHLFHACIKKYLSGTTRIIVTHQLQLLKQVDTVVILDRGSVSVQGTFDTLSKSDLSFLKTEDDESDVDEDDVETGEYDEDGDRPTRRFSRRRTLSHLKANANDTEIIESRKSTEEELVEKGKLSGHVYATYFRAGGNPICITFLIVCYIAGQVAMSGVDYWLSYWTDEQMTKSRLLSTLSNTTRNENVMASLWYDEFGFFNPEVAVYIYTIILITCVALVILRSMWFMRNNMNSSRNLHNKMFSSLLRAKMRFFNATPSGRILNRFSKDIGTMDEVLPQAMMEGLQSFLLMLGIIALVIIANYWMVIPTIVIGIIYYIIGSYYIKTAQDVKRLEGVAKSPVFSHVNSTLSGLTTIRSRGDVTVSFLRKDFDRYQDVHTAAWYTTLSTAESFGFVLDLLSCIFISCVCFLFLSNEDDTISGSNVGLAISQSLILTGMLQYGVRQSAEVVTQMTAVERVLQYTNLPQEGTLVSSKPPSSTWPSKGGVKFEKVNLKHNDEGPTVLKNLNFEIQPGWKIGIVGRTGAGKSSLISALFRLVDDGLTGEIIIDNVDIRSIGLQELRPKISIIPQEPVLFSASLRFNLDPFGQYTDSQLWDCLREAELSDTVPSLDHQVAEGGANFSAGQRQLICLARAILRNNRILVLDEATANIDPHTDALIQKTIRQRFANCTVLTIAHRLNTIMDSNLVLVIEQGSIVEFDHPHLLLQNPDSHFSRMVEQTGKSMGEILARTAEHTYNVSRNESEQHHRNLTRLDCTIDPTS